MQVFKLPVLPAQRAQMPVLTKNVTVQGGENLPCYNESLVLFVLEVQGRRVRFISRPHSYRHPCGANLGHAFFIPLPPPLLVAPPPADCLPVTRLARDIGKTGMM